MSSACMFCNLGWVGAMARTVRLQERLRMYEYVGSNDRGDNVHVNQVKCTLLNYCTQYNRNNCSPQQCPQD